MVVRPATADDAQAVAAIYNQGIEEGAATLETRPRAVVEVRRWIAGSERPFLIAENGDEPLGFAALLAYSERAVYGGIGQCMLYVDRRARRRGIGRALLGRLAEEAAGAGYHKLVGKLLASNRASVELVRGCGFREVGVHRRHGRLAGEWRDVLVVERLLERPTTN